jgi:Fe-S oxidoreductase
METALANLRRNTRAAVCAECGKCTAVCPLAACGGFSARAVACQQLDEEVLGRGVGVRRCLTCGSCDLRCPQGIMFMELVRGVRELSPREDPEACPHGGALQSVMRIMARGGTVQDRLGWLEGGLKTEPAKGEVFYWAGCSSYFDAYFSDLSVGLTKASQAAVRVLNGLGVSPVVSPEERCCGHDLLWTGDREHFDLLAKHNVELVMESGAETLVTPCAECLRTWKIDYEPFLRGRPLRILHLSEYLAERLPELRLKENGKQRVTFQDPCRLGRHLGIYDPPRQVLNALPGVELAEMPRSGPRALCCAGGTWTHCDRFAKEIQIGRLQEARETGAEVLVTSCPKCRIHLRCAMQDPHPQGEVAIEMRDLAELVAERLEE